MMTQFNMRSHCLNQLSIKCKKTWFTPKTVCIKRHLKLKNSQNKRYLQCKRLDKKLDINIEKTGSPLKNIKCKFVSLDI